MLTRDIALKWFLFTERWEWHCLNVASISEKLAKQIGVDSEYAFIYGLVHDIGRKTNNGKLNPKSHPVEGYKFLTEGENSGKGYEKIAMSCITHTFPDLNDITIVPGMCHPDWDKKERRFDEIDTFITLKLEKYTPTIYDTIVLLADLMSGNNTTITIEQRLINAYTRFGDKPNKLLVYSAIEKRKSELEKLITSGLTIEEIVGLKKQKN
ncbi:MAG: HDIG domain-containing protein [Clostridia bacterium]|nr:HDIG domain-containing protein [Clostridia bacterium]